jgi:O-antigen ligase
MLIYEINLSTTQMALIALLCAYIVCAGRPEWAVAIYLAAGLWGRVLMFGPYAHIWVFIPTMGLSAIVYLVKKRSLNVLPNKGRWIIVWMVIWWCWMGLLTEFLGQTDVRITVYRSLCLYIIAPLPIILTFGDEIARIRGFALAFIITAICGGLVSFGLYGQSMEHGVLNATMFDTNSYLLIGNYHLYGYAAGISLILSVISFVNGRNKSIKLFYLVLACCSAFMLILSGSRQSVAGALIVLLFFTTWAFLRNIKYSRQLVIILGFVMIIIVGILLMKPYILGRDRSLSSSAEHSLSDRAYRWGEGFDLFIDSPIYGSGYKILNVSHNIFVGLLAEQGLIGVVFLTGFLIFFIKITCGIWTEGESERAVWRMAFLCVALFGIFHSCFSGSVLSIYELYWSSAFLWKLSSGTEKLPEGDYTGESEGLIMT